MNEFKGTGENRPRSSGVFVNKVKNEGTWINPTKRQERIWIVSTSYDVYYSTVYLRNGIHTCKRLQTVPYALSLVV